MFDRIADQFGVVFNAELLHEAHLVRADGLGTQHEHIGYSIDALARRQQVQHLELTIRQDLVRCGVAGMGVEDHDIDQLRINEAPTRRQLADRSEQDLKVAVLGHIARRARA